MTAHARILTTGYYPSRHSDRVAFADPGPAPDREYDDAPLPCPLCEYVKCTCTPAELRQEVRDCYAAIDRLRGGT